MDPDLSALDAFLDRTEYDGYLIHADSEDSNQYYLSGFDAPDPYMTLYDGSTRLLFPRSMEYGRAKRESRADTVERYVDFAYASYIEKHGQPDANWHAVRDFLAAYDVESVAVPAQFPVQTADGLRDRGITVGVDHDGVVDRIRATKTAVEVEHVREAQATNQRAMAAAERLIADADIDDDGTLRHEGEVLTSERVKREIEFALLEENCGLDDTIVACGADAADPHDRGSGPLAAHEAIIIDIFPKNKSTNYHGDLTRTFCRGTPSDTIREWYDLTARAQDAAMDAVEPGVTGEAVHDAVCDVYEDAGVPTVREDETAQTGFIHSTGHGVGLDVHEGPSLGPGGPELEPGHVITIEPGLYDPEVGGVRIEDLLVVTEDGYENLTDYERTLVVGS